MSLYTRYWNYTYLYSLYSTPYCMTSTKLQNLNNVLAFIRLLWLPPNIMFNDCSLKRKKKKIIGDSLKLAICSLLLQSSG